MGLCYSCYDSQHHTKCHDFEDYCPPYQYHLDNNKFKYTYKNSHNNIPPFNPELNS